MCCKDEVSSHDRDRALFRGVASSTLSKEEKEEKEEKNEPGRLVYPEEKNEPGRLVYHQEKDEIVYLIR